MIMNELVKKVKEFEKELTGNKLVIKEKFELADQPAQNAQISTQRSLNRIESSVLNFYDVANGIEIKWKAADTDMQQNEITGSVKINSFLQVVKDWNGVVFFDKDPVDSPVRKFFPLDFFADEAAVGFCTKGGWRNMLYLYQFEGELIPLYVDFKSYLQLMLEAKACFYWQYLIIELISNEENEVSRRIKKYLPDVFPGFSFTTFTKLFNDTRIKL